MKKALEIGKNSLIITLITLLVLVCVAYLAEIFLRRNDPFLELPFDGNYYKANQKRYEGKIVPPEDWKDNVYTWGHKVVNNRFYRRERDFKTPKPKGTIRIIVVGDSFTWGAGLAVNERYSNLLDSTLNHEFPQAKWEVVNFAFSGGPTTGERDVLRAASKKVEPDLVIVGFCLNDPQPISQNYSVEREEFRVNNGPRLDSIRSFLRKVKLLYVGDLMVTSTYSIAEKLGYIPDWETSLNRVYQKSSAQWKDFTVALADIRSISDSLNCPRPVFAAFNQIGAIPVPESVNSSNKSDKYFNLRLGWFDQARGAADSLGFVTVSYADEFKRELEAGTLTFEQLTLNSLDTHPSPEMNRTYTRKIFDAMKKEIVPALLERVEK